MNLYSPFVFFVDIWWIFVKRLVRTIRMIKWSIVAVGVAHLGEIAVFHNKGKLYDMLQDKQHFVNISEKSGKVPIFRAKKYFQAWFFCAMYPSFPKNSKMP